MKSKPDAFLCFLLFFQQNFQAPRLDSGSENQTTVMQCYKAAGFVR